MARHTRRLGKAVERVDQASMLGVIGDDSA